MGLDKKVLLVGWDAADWKIIHPLMDANLMPTTRKLVENGVMANITTLSPVFSPMLWTSIATGKMPYKHGVHGFAEPTADGKAIQPVTNLSRKTKAIWNILCQNEKRCNVVGWWPSSPAEPINGVMVSNHYQRAPGPLENGWPIPPGTVHPPHLEKELAEIRFHPEQVTADHLMPFLPHGAQIDQAKDRRFESVVKVLADCTTIQNCATFLMENEPWDFMAVYFDAIDHFSHGFMKYHPPKLDWVSQADYEMFKNVVATGYVYHDMMLARLLELAGDHVTVILMSDHGFHPDHLRLPELPLEPAGPAAEHREHGIFVMCGSGIKQDSLIHGVSLLDIAPTILHLFGLAVGDDMDGRVITEAFESRPKIQRIASWDRVRGTDGMHPPDKQLGSRESQEAIKQLVELGYIEEPSQDRDQAVKEISQELQYNLARSYMDGNLHGEAVPLLTELYLGQPLEFRFGVQLAICLQALGHADDLQRLVADIQGRWGRATEAAQEKIAEINEIARERAAALDQEFPLTGFKLDAAPDVIQPLFSEQELSAVRKIRKLCSGNRSTLDYLNGWAAMAKGDNQAALEHFNRAGASRAPVPGFYFHLAEAYRALGRFDDATHNYQKVLELDPHNAGAHLGLARMHLSENKNKPALAAAKKALALKYQLAPAHYCVGICKMRAADFSGAEAALQTAVEINPNFAEAFSQLAIIYEQAFHDPKKADECRHLAEELQSQAEENVEKSILPSLTSLDEIDFEDELPKFSTTEVNRQPCLFQKKTESHESVDGTPVIVVSGLPRSGTSLLMQMLVAGGMEPLTDGARQADASNPRGYFELEKAKSLPRTNDWLREACGKAVKIISPLIGFLPQHCQYRVVFVERDLSEVIASQNKMISRLGGRPAELQDERLAQFFTQQNVAAREALTSHGIPVQVVAHAELISQPLEVAQSIETFLGLGLDINAMSNVVEPGLYREKLTN